MTEQNSNDTKLISVTRAASILGVNPQTLRRWDKAKKLVAIRVGSRNDRKYKLKEIIKLLEQQ
jgi:DNA-binding transcriptional MerR regulator